MANYKLDIFETLGKLNSPKCKDIYSDLSEDERKGFAPLVVMRWMSGTSDERQIMLLNEFVNQYVFSLGKHPHLLMQLLQTTSSKKEGRRYNWIPVKSKQKNALSLHVVSEYFDISIREVKLLNPFPGSSEILKMAEELGMQKDDMKKLEKEISNA